jgi:hypothetical protein
MALAECFMSPVCGVGVMLCVLDCGEQVKLSTIEGSGRLQRHVPPPLDVDHVALCVEECCSPARMGFAILLAAFSWVQCKLLTYRSGRDRTDGLFLRDAECEYPFVLSVGVVLILGE